MFSVSDLISLHKAKRKFDLADETRSGDENQYPRIWSWSCTVQKNIVEAKKPWKQRIVSRDNKDTLQVRNEKALQVSGKQLQERRLSWALADM